MRKLINGFYEEVDEKTEDQLIVEVCAHNNYTLVSNASKDIVIFKNLAGEMIGIEKTELSNHIKKNDFYCPYVQLSEDFLHNYAPKMDYSTIKDENDWYLKGEYHKPDGAMVFDYEELNKNNTPQKNWKTLLDFYLNGEHNKSDDELLAFDYEKYSNYITSSLHTNIDDFKHSLDKLFTLDGIFAKFTTNIDNSEYETIMFTDGDSDPDDEEDSEDDGWEDAEDEDFWCEEE